MLILIFLALGIYIGTQLSRNEEQPLFPPVIDHKKGKHSRSKEDIESEKKQENKGVWEVKSLKLTKKAINTLAIKPSKLAPTHIPSKSSQKNTAQIQELTREIYEKPSSMAQEKIVNEDGEFQTFEQYNRPTRKEIRQEERYQKFEKYDAPIEKTEEASVEQNNPVHSAVKEPVNLSDEWDSLNDNFEKIFN